MVDEGGVKRSNEVDGAGRLVAVNELNTDSSVYARTTYAYDSLDGLIGVTQPGMAASCGGAAYTRSFVNSSLGRLKSACNPENGTIAYGYDGNGTLTLKTDARSVITTFSYDALNRLTGKGYAGETVTAPDTATPNVTYAYEGGKDFRTAVTTSAGSYEVGGFDALGRPSVAVQRAGAQNFTFSNLQWAAMGQMVSMTYPSGRVASYSYDRAGRPSGLTGKVNASAAAETYASAIS